MAPGAGWRAKLAERPGPFLEALAHPPRRAMRPLYVTGLIGRGGRENVPSQGPSAWACRAKMPRTIASPPGYWSGDRWKRRRRGRPTD